MYISGRWWLRTMTKYKKCKGELARDGVHSVNWTPSCETKICQWVKRKAFNECILAVMTYDCETWSLSNTQLEKLVTTQRKMERIMIGVTLKDRKSTEWIRKQSGVTDIIRSIGESKHRWVGHVARRHDNRWTIRVTEWILRGNKRLRGRPRTRWCDDLIQYVGPTWSHISRDRKLWRACREGFLLRERETPWVMMMMMMMKGVANFLCRPSFAKSVAKMLFTYIDTSL